MNKRALCAFGVVAATAAGAAPASAQEAGPRDARVGGGTTTLKLDAAVAKALSANGVKVGLVGNAKAGSGGIGFPVTGGAIRPENLRGSVSHSGGLRFSAGGKSLTLRNFRYTIRKAHSSLSAQVGNSRVTILRLVLDKAKVGRSGPLTKTASGIRVQLTAAAAGALNTTFSTKLFKRGLGLGTVSTRLNLADAVFGGGSTTLVPDPGTAAALTSLGVTLRGFGSATAAGGGLAFPIDRGKVDAKTLAGSIGHFGSGLELVGGPTLVRLTDFVIGIDDTPALSARLGNKRVDILSLDVSGVKVSTTADSVVVSNVVAKLTAAAADALNAAFKVTAFKEGLVLGTAAVNGVTR